MNAEDFKRARMMFAKEGGKRPISKAEFARRLGIGRNTVAEYEAGKAEIPLVVALAVAALVRGHKPWPE